MDHLPIGLFLIFIFHIVFFLAAAREISKVNKKMMVLFSALAIILSFSLINKPYNNNNNSYNYQLKRY